jgi:outer membrane protein insertion porin family
MTYKHLVFLFYILIIALSISGMDPENEGKIIEKIEIEGLSNYNKPEILSQLQSQEKTAFSYKILKDDIQRLYSTGFFSKIDWEIVNQGAGLKIIIRVTENEIVEEIFFEGFKEINADSLKNDFKLKANNSFNEFYLLSDLRLIKEKYKEKGYHFVESGYKTAKGLRGLLITYSVREGPYVKIRNVKIVGAKSFPPKTTFLFFTSDPILDLMTNQPSHWYSSQIYNESALSIDLVRIENFYRNEGWFDADAYIENISFTEDKSKVDITVNIREGNRYSIRKIILEGNTSITTQDITSSLKIKESSPYREIDIAKAIQSIKRRYGKLGMIDCDIETRVHYPQEGAVDITFSIHEGGKKYLETVNITGNHKTKDKVIRRALTIHPGELMDYEKIETSRDRISSSMYFQSVKYDIEDGSSEEKKNLSINVEEATTGMINFGGGYSSSNGFGGRIAFSQRNFDISRTPRSFSDFFSGNSFAGGGQNFTLAWQPGVKVTQFGIKFTEPYLMDKPVELSLDYNVYERDWNDYSEWRNGEGISLSRRFAKGWEIGIQSRIQNIEISDIESDAPSLIKELKGMNRLRSFGPFISLDRRDSWIYPTKGYQIDMSLTNTGGFMGGDFDFTKAFVRSEFFMPLIPDQKKLVFNIVGKFGRITKFGSTESIPFFERFYAGGTETVRGFSYHTISPKENDIAVGGNISNIFNMEITYPLYTQEISENPYQIVRLVLFYDAGNVVNKFKELKFADYRTSLGFGFRFYLSQMPLSLYIGYPIKKQPGDERDTIQLDMGLMY